MRTQISDIQNLFVQAGLYLQIVDLEVGTLRIHVGFQFVDEASFARLLLILLKKSLVTGFKVIRRYCMIYFPWCDVCM